MKQHVFFGSGILADAQNTNAGDAKPSINKSGCSKKNPIFEIQWLAWLSWCGSEACLCGLRELCAGVTILRSKANSYFVPLFGLLQCIGSKYHGVV